MAYSTRFIDDDNLALKNFLDDWAINPATKVDVRKINFPLENCTKTKFDFNEIPLESLIENEIKENFIPAYKEFAKFPLHGGLKDPFVVELSQNRVQFVCENAFTWNGFFSAKTILYFYRRLTTAEYQTPEHMRLLYALAAAVELYTATTLFIDDLVDGTTTRNGTAAWHLKTATPVAMDCVVLMEMAREIFRSCIPDSHPNKVRLVKIMDEYIQRSSYYWCFTAQLIQQQKHGNKRHHYIDFEKVTRDTVMQRTYQRASQYIWALFELSRLFACYNGIMPEDHILIRDQIFHVSEIICYVDDLQDTANATSPLDNVTEEELSDIMSGEIHNFFLLAALEFSRAADSNLGTDERKEILDTLDQHFGTKDIDDGRQVLAMYRKYGIHYRVKQMMRAALSEYQQEAELAVSRVNMPRDVVWNLANFGFMGTEDKRGSMDNLRLLRDNHTMTLTTKELLLMDLIDEYF